MGRLHFINILAGPRAVPCGACNPIPQGPQVPERAAWPTVAKRATQGTGRVQDILIMLSRQCGQAVPAVPWVETGGCCLGDHFETE